MNSKATSDHVHHVSSSYDTQSTSGDEGHLPRRKTRRVRSLIKSSITKFTNSRDPELHHSTSLRRHSLPSPTDKRPFPFGQCRVCLDKATGAHYGVPTCEGCKGFFKRSILRKEKYRCYFGDGCIINSDNRNRCKACRFQKCLQEGMSIEGVRMGRIPKLVKEKALAEYHHHSSDDSTFSVTSSSPSRVPSSDSISNHVISTDYELPLIDEQFFPNELDPISMEDLSAALPSCISYVLPANFTIDETKPILHESEETTRFPCSTQFDGPLTFHFALIDRIKQLMSKIAHPTTSVALNDDEAAFIRYLRRKIFDLCHTYNQRTRQLVERMNSMISQGVSDFPGDHSSLQDVWAGLTDAIPFHVKNLIAFARKIPAVNELSVDDFQRIMNNRLFDFWLIKHAPLIRHNQSYTLLPNGLQYTRQWMSEIIGEEMVRAMFEFANELNALDLRQEEYALLFPIIICSQDSTLDDQETVRHIQDCYFYTLYTQMLMTRTHVEARQLFCNLLQVVDRLPFLNELQAKKIDTLIPKREENNSLSSD